MPSDARNCAGFDYEEIDDLRMAVSELCHLVIRAGSTGSVTLHFEIGPDGVAVDGKASGVDSTHAAGNEFTAVILETITDFHEVGDEPDGKSFRIVKRGRTPHG